MTVAGNGAHSQRRRRTRRDALGRHLPWPFLWGRRCGGWPGFPYRMLAQWGVAAVPAQIGTASVALLLLTLVYRGSLGTLRWSWLLAGWRSLAARPTSRLSGARRTDM